MFGTQKRNLMLSITTRNVVLRREIQNHRLQEGVLGKGMRIKPIYPHFNGGHVVEDCREEGGGVGSRTTWQLEEKGYDDPSGADRWISPKRQTYGFGRDECLINTNMPTIIRISGHH